MNKEEKCYLIIYSETDEIHHYLTDEKTGIKICECLSSISEKPDDYEFERMLDMVYSNENNFFTQTYCNQDWPFNGYNIVKVVHIPNR